MYPCVLQYLSFLCITIEGSVRVYGHVNMYINHSCISLDIHLDLGFSTKLETLSEVFHCLKSQFFPISALYEVDTGA